MQDRSQSHIGQVRKRLASGEYRVDADRVAAAMLQKIGAIVVCRGLSPGSGRARPRAGNDHPGA